MIVVARLLHCQISAVLSCAEVSNDCCHISEILGDNLFAIRQKVFWGLKWFGGQGFASLRLASLFGMILSVKLLAARLLRKHVSPRHHGQDRVKVK